MKFLMLAVFYVVTLGILMSVQASLIKLGNPLWGSIVPIIILGAGIYTYCFTDMPFKWSTSLIFVIPFLRSLDDWITQRRERKEQLELEIEQMKAKDIC